MKNRGYGMTGKKLVSILNEYGLTAYRFRNKWYIEAPDVALDHPVTLNIETEKSIRNFIEYDVLKIK